MSKERNEIFTCEKCGKEFEVTLYDSINVTLDPDLRNKFLTRELYLFKCPFCGKEHYSVYPVLYHDMEKQFMVITGPLSQIYDFFDGTQKQMNDLSAIIGNYKRTGATDVFMAIEKVVSLENNLDHRYISIYKKLLEKNYIESSEGNNEMPNLVGIHLGYDENNNIAFIYILENDEGHIGSVPQPFEREEYDNIANHFEKIIEGSSNIIFTDKMAERAIYGNKLWIGYMKKAKQPIALVVDVNGVNFMSKFYSFNKESFNEQDNVILEDRNNNLTRAKIVRIIENETLFQMVDDYNEMPSILKKANFDLTTTGDSDDELENEDLLSELKKYNKTGVMPFELIKESDVAVGMVSRIVTDDNLVDNNGEIDIEKISDPEFMKNNVKNDFQDYVIDDQRYLCIYTDQKNIIKDDNNGVSPWIFNLDDIINFIIQNSERYEGIVINPRKDEIVLSAKELYLNYIAERILQNDKRMKWLLGKLTDKEISYVGKDSINYISMIYFDNKNPEQISKEIGVNKADIGKAISEGYKRLKTVIRADY